MNCTHCGTPIPLNHRPGLFLAIALTAIAAAAAIPLLWRTTPTLIVAGTLAFIALLAAGGVCTSIVDASCHVYARTKRRGVECPHCHHVNRIYPWST